MSEQEQEHSWEPENEEEAPSITKSVFEDFKKRIKGNRYQKDWYRKNPDKYILAKTRKMQRLRAGYIGMIVNGKLQFIEAPGKRLYPDSQKCELCNKPHKLSYHHWNNKDFSRGMWLCKYCHILAGQVESGKADCYLRLKQVIEEETNGRKPEL
jgi:hypothetical protein